jgi:hypothetical protein
MGWLIDILMVGVPAFIAGHYMSPWIDDKTTPQGDE